MVRLTLERAKTYSVPNHIIEKAIEKAKGAGEENYDHLRYEGFGPSGSMIIVATIIIEPLGPNPSYLKWS